MNYQQNQGFIRTIDSFKKKNWPLPSPIKLIFNEKNAKWFGSKAIASYFCDPIDKRLSNDGRFVYRLGQPPFTGQRRVRFPYRLQSLSTKLRGFFRLRLRRKLACVSRRERKKPNEREAFVWKALGKANGRGSRLERSEKRQSQWQGQTMRSIGSPGSEVFV